MSSKNKTKADLEKEIIALKAQNKDLEVALAAAKSSGIVSLPVEGVFYVELEDTSSEEGFVRKAYKFKNGLVNTFLETGEKVSSASLIKVANGEELSEKEQAADPVLLRLGQEKAQARLTHFVSIGASVIEEVAAEPIVNP